MDEINRIGLRNKNAKVNAAEISCKSHCPTCNYGPLETATCVEIAEEDDHTDSVKANKGDITICARCGEVLFFDEEVGGELKIALATKEVWDKINEDEEFTQLIKQVQTKVRNRNARKF